MNGSRIRQGILIRSFSGIKRLGIIILISTLAFSFVGTVWAVYINSFVNSEALVGLVSSLFVLISFISYLLIVPIIEKYDKLKLYSFGSILVGIGYFLYSLIGNLYFFLFAALIVTVSVTIRTSSMGLIVEHSSKRRELSRNEGFLYVISNIAWVIGPLIVGVLLRELGIKSVFIAAAILIFLSAFLFRILISRCKIPKRRVDLNPFRNFRDFFRGRDRRKAYLLSSGVTFWWGLVFVYFPLLILKNLHEDYIGYLLFAVILPLVITQYSFAKLSARIGFKKIFFVGFMIPAVAAILCTIFFHFWFVVIALIIASIGMAMTESTTESYFFDICKGKEDQRFYSPYNTAIDAGALFGELVPALLLFFVPFRFIFLVYGAGLLFLAILATSIKDVVEEKKKNVLIK